MKLAVCLDVLFHILPLVVIGDLVQAAHQLLLVLGGHELHRALDAVAFQKHAHVKDLLDVLRGELAHENAPVGQFHHQAVRRKTAQSLPHRAAADAQRACQLHFVQPLAGLVAAVADVLLDGVVDLRADIHHSVFFPKHTAHLPRGVIFQLLLYHSCIFLCPLPKKDFFRGGAGLLAPFVIGLHKVRQMPHL